MTKLVDFPEPLLARTFGFFEDFDHLVTLDRWTTIVADVNTSAAVVDGVGGQLKIAGSAVDNDEAYVHTSFEIFKFADDKPILVEARLQFSEAATDDANILFGMMNAAAANHLLDNGGGPAASYSGMTMFKVDGGTRWQAETSITTVQTTTDLSAANSLDKVAKTAGGAAFQTLRMKFNPFSSTQADVLFFIDDVHVARHLFTYTNATEMDVILGIKNGGANAETLVVDYVQAWQLR